MQELYVQRLAQEGKLAGASVTDAEVAAALRDLPPARRRRPVLISFRQIIIPTLPGEAARNAARVKAESLLVRLKAGADFGLMARRESMDESTRESGGDIGFHRRGDGLVQEFENWIFRLAPGQLSPVFETRRGFHIARVDRVTGGTEVQSRHILIIPTVDSADYLRTKALADSVAAQWRAGAPFDSLKRFADPGEALELPKYPRDSLPPSYLTALQDKKVGDVTVPFELTSPLSLFPSFAIVRVDALDETQEYSEAELRVGLKNQLARAKGYRKLVDRLRAERYIRIFP
jgi:peptidyl-prolyl cis-trans isomerase SurA